MRSRRTSSVGEIPEDPVGVVVADLIVELLGGVRVELHYTPLDEAGEGPPHASGHNVLATSSRRVLDGWWTTLTIRVDERLEGLVAGAAGTPEPFGALAEAALRAVLQFRDVVTSASPALTPSLHRALRDTIVVELLAQHHGGTANEGGRLLAETLEFVIELGGSRVESQNVTHGVVITDALPHEPRLSVPYPSGLRAAKRTPLLFDGQRSVLIVDRAGRARTELQRHRLERLLPAPTRLTADDAAFVDTGSLVALATRRLGGIGFYLREDRSIWTFLDGEPLVVRRGEHWTAFPLWLATAIGQAIGGGHAVELVVQAALMISVQPSGAILGIVDDVTSIDEIVPAKDRFDLRNQFDPAAMRPETRLHHLIDAVAMDAQTLARLAALDGATVVDRHGRLLAYGAIVSSDDSQHEGARAAAARALSSVALAVLKVSEDGDITVLRHGEVVATLLRSGSAMYS